MSIKANSIKESKIKYFIENKNKTSI